MALKGQNMNDSIANGAFAKQCLNHAGQIENEVAATSEIRAEPQKVPTIPPLFQYPVFSQIANYGARERSKHAPMARRRGCE